MSQLVYPLVAKIWQGRTKKIVLGMFAFVLGLMALSWLALPSYVKRVAAEQVQQQLGRKLEIAEISFSPLTLTLSAGGIKLYEPDQKTSALTIKNAVFSLSGASLYHRALVMDEVMLDQPHVHLSRSSADGHGRYNYSDILDRIAAMPKSDAPFRFSLANVQLQGGSIQFDDKVLDKTIALSAVQLGVPFLSNFPSSVNNFVQPMLSAKINGSTFALKGRSKPFVDTLETSLAIDVEQLDLPAYIAYLPVALPLQIQSGKLTTKLDLTFSRKNQRADVLLSGDLQLDALSLQDKVNQPLLKVAQLRTHLKQFNLVDKAIGIDKFMIDQPEVWLALDSKGALNWAALAAAKQAKPTPEVKLEAKPEAKPDDKAVTTPLVTLADFSLNKGRVHFADALLATPANTTDISDIQLSVKQLSTAANAKAALVALSAKLEQDQSLKFDGEFNPVTADVAGKLNLNALQLGAYQAYLNRFLAAQLTGRVSLNSHVSFSQGQVKLDETDVRFDEIKLVSKDKNEGQFALKSLALDKLSMSTETRLLTASSVQIDGLSADIRRDANAKLNLQKWLVPVKSSPVAAASAKSGSAPAKWKLNLAKFSIAGSNLNLLDQAVSPSVSMTVGDIAFSLDNLSSELASTMNLKWSSLINRKAKLTIAGNISPQLRQIALSLDGQLLPVASLSPYVADMINVDVLRGSASLKGKLNIANLEGRPLQTKYDGNFSLNEFKIVEKGETDDFLQWKAINLDGISASFGGAKQYFVLNKLALNDFYTKLILSEKGGLNLRNILTRNKKQAAAEVVMTPVNPVNAAAEVPASVAKTDQVAKLPDAKAGGNSLLIRVGQTTLRGGNINFTDNFIKPNYTANLTGVGGSIGTISSDQPGAAAIQLAGKIDNDAPLLISGTLNPLSTPIFLDIKASANGIQLTRLSQYSEKYAGYAIAKGQLSAQVSYHVEKNQLQAQNEVRLDQLTFGERKDGPYATKLPVNLALALLRDNDGVISINLPISGSLSDPEFSVGGIIFKVLANLITKAVTSPFALLGAAFGGGDELAYIEFVPGSASLSAASIAKLDSLVKALNNRSKLKLDITGRIDPQTDTDGLKLAMLDNKIRAIKSREEQKKGAATEQGEGALAITPADRKNYMEEVYRTEKFVKPRNMIGMAKTLPQEEAMALILSNAQVSPEMLRSLAQKRADAVFDYLEQKGGVAKDRLFLIAPRLNSENIADKALPNRVDLSLK